MRVTYKANGLISMQVHAPVDLPAGALVVWMEGFNKSLQCMLASEIQGRGGRDK
jgi:hypothetical protein